LCRLINLRCGVRIGRNLAQGISSPIASRDSMPIPFSFTGPCDSAAFLHKLGNCTRTYEGMTVGVIWHAICKTEQQGKTANFNQN